ncbi:hypothetical protein LJR290_007465 [Variovorax sp. LjRoot290]|uniref:hypothetical protein n=1 Tax=Variovorax sp. LjRoot290 TaxID=3342316 RepID=UPI003ED05741
MMTRTQHEIEALQERLAESGIGRTNPRTHSAVRDFQEGVDLEECAARAVRHEAAARETWITTWLDPWAARHGLTRAQALSVAFDDSPFNPANPSRDQVTLRDAHAWNGQEHSFASYLMGEGRDVVIQEAEPDAAPRPAG